jgi:predicted transposase/invertase (TIGR01784 family)
MKKDKKTASKSGRAGRGEKAGKSKKDIHHIHDKGYKDLYSKKEIALDLFKNISNAAWTKNLKPEDLELSNNTFVTSDYEEKEADIIYKANVNGKEVVFYILLEFQSTVDYTMPLRLLQYMCQILNQYSANVDYKKYDKNIKLPAIVPIVLYNGQQVWDVPKQFRKMIYNEELFGNSLINFEYAVFDISNDKKLTKDNLIELKNVTAAIFLLDQKIDALEFLQRIKIIALYFNSLSNTEIRAIKRWIKNTVVDPLATSAIKILEADREDVELMVARNAFILDEMKEKAKKEGREEGIKEGIKEGREKGIKEGKEEGIKEGIKEGRKEGIKEGIEQTIRKMINKGMDSETIADILEINISSVIKIKEKCK